MNVLDPNRVVGAPYFVRQVVLKNGRIETGLLAAEDERSITLKAENDARKVIQKKDVEELTVQQKSVMPEGLAGAMSVQDFRDLIRYVMVHPFLTNVEVAGPFRGHPGRIKEEAWKKPRVGVFGAIPLPPTKERGWSFVRAEVTAPAALRTRLQLGAVPNVSVWLNGTPVNGDKRDGARQAGMAVELKPGKNTLLFSVSYQGDREVFSARLIDPQAQTALSRRGRQVGRLRRGDGRQQGHLQPEELDNAQYLDETVEVLRLLEVAVGAGGVGRLHVLGAARGRQHHHRHQAQLRRLTYLLENLGAAQPR